MTHYKVKTNWTVAAEFKVPPMHFLCDRIFQTILRQLKIAGSLEGLMDG